MQCEEVSYIDAFPREVELGEVAALPLNLTGCVDMFAMDTLAIFKTPEKDYLWEAFSLSSLKPVGQLLRKGHGNDEFAMLPSCEMLTRTDSVLYCDFWVIAEKKWHRLNLSRTLQEGHTVGMQTRDFRMYDDLSDVFALSDSSFLFVTNKDYTGYSRSLWTGGEPQEIAHLGNLNDKTVENDINTLSVVRCMNPKRMMVAEAMLSLNQINLYSLKSGKSLTLCVGDELSDVEEVDNFPKKLRHYYYGYIEAHDDYFVALFQDASVFDYLRGKGKCELQFFDWSGRPLLRLKLPFLASSFHISRDRYVYVFSNLSEEESLYKYDCGDSLRDL